MAAAARPRLACAMTLTFGECAENHVGNQQLGEIAEAGFGIAELTAARDALLAQGHPAELLELGGEDAGAGSPDRADALVWAVTDLMPGRSPAGPSVRVL